MASSLVRPRWETPDPPGVTGTYGDLALRWARRKLGLRAGAWQAHEVRRVLRHDRRGDLIHRLALISAARQNGKSVIVRIILGWILDEGRFLDCFREWTTLLAAAHDAKQARIIYNGVSGDLARLDSTKVPERLRGEKGERPEIELTKWLGLRAYGTGERPQDLVLDTVTSEPGSARGLSAGLIAWDEMLTQRDWDMWEALSPTQSAQRSPIMLLTSTAGHEDSVVLRSFYDRLRRQASGDEAPDPTFYGAWWESEDEDAGLDWRQIKMANPALGDGRLTKAAIAAEHAILPAESWRRERLNHFVDVRAAGAFGPGIWAACRADRPLDGLRGPYSLGVDVQPGWQRATITAAAIRPDGRIGVEIYRDLRADTAGKITAGRVIEEISRFPEMDMTLEIVYDGISGIAPEIRRHAQETALPYVELGRREFVAACMDAAELVHAGRLAVDDRLLDAQVPFVARRDVGSDGMFCFSRGLSLGPIDAFLSMTFAAHSAISLLPQPRIT